MTDRGIWSRR